MYKQKYYEIAKRAYMGISFCPEIRAADFCAGFAADIDRLRKIGVPEEKIAKYEYLTVHHLLAKSRCVSTMIAGPANFNTRRAEKANAVERKRSDICLNYFNRIVNEAKEGAFYAAFPESRPILTGDSDAVERLQEKLEYNKKYLSQLKEVKSLINSGMSNAKASEKVGLPAPVEWHSFNIQYACKAVKEVENRIANLMAVKDSPTTDYTLNGIRVFHNKESMRLQLYFDGKPHAAMISLLKSNAFKWSPRNRCWQRQLTKNSISAAEKIIKYEE